jgi:hypothetical protein
MTTKTLTPAAVQNSLKRAGFRGFRHDHRREGIRVRPGAAPGRVHIIAQMDSDTRAGRLATDMAVALLQDGYVVEQDGSFLVVTR